GVYVANQVQWTPWLRSQLGLRADLAAADVDSDTAANSGRDAAGILSPKLGLTLGPWRDTQLYANVGAALHSTDARGVTISVDPVRQQAQQRVPLLVRTKGAELGEPTGALAGLTATLALW